MNGEIKIINFNIKSLPSWKTHCENGSPTYVIGHLHIGEWLTTWHSAFGAQDPGQGSLHFIFIHAKLYEHSLFVIHSGLQFGGEPINSGKQEHDGDSPLTLHWEFGPQGDGTQGLPTYCGISAAIFSINFVIIKLCYYIFFQSLTFSITSRKWITN